MTEALVRGNERQIRHGGLMRCCLDTLHNHTELTYVGQVIPCSYHTGDCMEVAADGVWEWIGFERAMAVEKAKRS